ncbi:hypothetical protein, partial [Vibrio sp. F13]
VLKSLNEHNNQVDNDFEFVAELNLGGEFVDDAHISRLHDIAQRTWTRTLSKTAGTSWIEQHRSQEHQPIPATECVLADLP